MLASRTFRVFVSSTFSDLRAERNALHERVFPRLKALCAAHNCRFQAIDLRWGVSEEAGLDQRTMPICLDEIRRCQRVSPRPNFIVLLGDRYGWRPLPHAIPSEEFDRIFSATPSGDRPMLAAWYPMDENARPPEHYLRPRKVDLRRCRTEEDERAAREAEAREWRTTERELQRILRAAVQAIDLPPDLQTKYFTSATEQEIVRGALGVSDAADHVFCFFRTIAGSPLSTTPAGDYLDLIDVNGAPSADADAHARLTRLKQQLRSMLPHNVVTYDAEWTSDAVTTLHLDRLCDDVERRLSSVIAQQIAALEARSPLAMEVRMHLRYGGALARRFVGRERYLDRVREYVNRPDGRGLALAGSPGSGKSAVLARAIHEHRRLDVARRRGRPTPPRAVLIVRFLGLTPSASAGRTLLDSLCDQISQKYGVARAETGSDYPSLVVEFERLLGCATPERPLVVFLDGLDQLSEADYARSLAWLPASLPPHVAVVVSTQPGECLTALKRRVPDSNIAELDALQRREAERLLDGWLTDAGRALQPDQVKYVIDRFAGCPLPLYLKLAFGEVRHWKSGAASMVLGRDVPRLLGGLFGRLSLKANHGRMLVARSLGLLAAARHGLTEDELLEVLSSDRQLFRDFVRRARHEPPERRLPVVLWSRLYFDLEPYLTERRVHGAALINFFHGQVRQVVEAMYLRNNDRLRRHRALSSYFGRQPTEVTNLRKLSELPRSQALGGRWKRLERTLTSFSFLDAKVNAQLGHDAVTDFDRALARMPAAAIDHPLYASRTRVADFASAFSQEFHATADRPSAIAQQLFNNLYGRDGLAGATGPVLRTFSDRSAERNGRPWFQRANASPHTSVSKALQRTILAHRDGVTAAAVSPTGRLVASGGGDGRCAVWRASDGSLVATVTGHTDAVAALAWLHDDDRPVVSAGRDGAICVWEWQTGRKLRGWRVPAEHRVRALVALDSPNHIATAGDDKLIRIWDVVSGAELGVLAGHKDRVLCLAKGAGPMSLVSGSDDRTIRVWSADPHFLLGSQDSVRAIAVDTRDGRIVSGDGGMLRQWNPAGSRPEREIQAHRQRITSVAVGDRAATSDRARRDTTIISGSDDETVKVWDAESLAERHTLQGHAGPVHVVATNPPGDWILSGGRDGTLRFWNPRAETWSGEADVEHDGRVTCLARLDGRAVASGSEDGTIRIWNDPDGRHVATLRPPVQHVTSLLALDGGVLAAGTTHGQIVVADTRTGAVNQVLEARPSMPRTPAAAARAGTATDIPAGEITSLARYGSRFFLSGGKDRTVRVWDRETWALARELKGARGSVESLLVSDELDLVVAVGSFREVAVWNGSQPAEAKLLTGHHGNVPCAALAQGRWLVTGSLDKTVRVWDLRSVLRPGETPLVLEGHRDAVTSVAIEPQAKLAASGGKDGQLLIWPLFERRPPLVLRCHRGPVRAVAFYDDEILLSYSDDRWLVATRLADGAEVAAIHLDSPITAMAAPDDIWLGTRRGSVVLLRFERPATPAASIEEDVGVGRGYSHKPLESFGERSIGAGQEV